MQQNNLDKIYEKQKDAAEYFRNCMEYLQKVLGEIDQGRVAKAVELILETRKRGNTIFFIGNGGSAATASHFAQDLSDSAKKAKRRGFKALSLTDNVAFISALGNDFGFETVFTGQMQDIFSQGDLLVAISASGNSPNILQAVKLAKARGGFCIGFTGFDGGELFKMSDVAIHVATPKGEYGPVESLHVTIAHMISSYIYYVLKSE